MKKSVICYKTSEPVFYNKGTKYEKSCDTFLAYETYKSLADAKAEAEEINTTKPEKLWNGEFAECDKKTYFAQEQEEMY